MGASKEVKIRKETRRGSLVTQKGQKGKNDNQKSPRVRGFFYWVSYLTNESVIRCSFGSNKVILNE